MGLLLGIVASLLLFIIVDRFLVRFRSQNTKYTRSLQQDFVPSVWPEAIAIRALQTAPPVDNMHLRIRVPGFGHNKHNDVSTASSHGSSEVREAPSSGSSRSDLLECPTPRFELKSNVRLQLYSHGTSLVTNDSDLTGDGDQTPIKDAEAQQVYQDLFLSGEFV